jgi:hypothetical protein
LMIQTSLVKFELVLLTFLLALIKSKLNFQVS